jgi:hypothetical protein
MSEQRKVFMICPVRSASPKEVELLSNHKKWLKSRGYKVRYPLEDTDQIDPIGFYICAQNRWAILHSDEIHVYFDSKSAGSAFDLGMSFYAGKPISIINYYDKCFYRDRLDDFGEFLLFYASTTKNGIKERSPAYEEVLNRVCSSSFYEEMLRKSEELKGFDIIELGWEPDTKSNPRKLFYFGMCFMENLLNNKPVILANPQEVIPTLGKSFNNVFRELDNVSRRRLGLFS